MRAISEIFNDLPRDRLLAEMSLWSADLGRLADEIGRIDDYADIYHVDVSDGHFSPALLFFPDLVAAARKASGKLIHVHLMVDEAVLDEQIDQFCEAGADIVTIHAELVDVRRPLDRIVKAGCLAGLVLKLETPVAAAAPWIDDVSILTLLGTRIGVKGQSLAPEAADRLREARLLLDRRTVSGRTLLAADGGIRENTVPGLRAAGADTIVMGSLAFNAEDLGERMAWVHNMPPFHQEA